MANPIKFSFFETEIAKYVSGVHSMSPGATNAEILAAESKLAIVFPAVYREFLHQYNGGSIFWKTIIFFGTPQAGQGESFELVNANLQKWPGIPGSYLAIAAYSYGDEICLAIDKTNNQKYEVIQWDHELGRIAETWPSLEDWLNDE